MIFSNLRNTVKKTHDIIYVIVSRKFAAMCNWNSREFRFA